MEDFEGNFYLFLGETDREGVTSRLLTSGMEFKKKKLESGIANWRQIFKYLDHPLLHGILAKFTNRTFRVFELPQYRELTDQLLTRIARTPHVVFIHESFFTGKHNLYDDYAGGEEQQEIAEQVFGTLSKQAHKNIEELLGRFDLNIITYVTNAELSVMADSFVDASVRNLLFRIYMPENRIWAAEADKVLSLFRDYLNKVSGLSVRQERHSTAHGVIYEFFGDHTVAPGEVPAKFEEFSRFMDECVSDPASAQRMLVALDIESRAIHDIVERYSKEGRRLQVDMKQEREKRLLSIRHRMESEIADEYGAADLAAINQLVDATLPRVEGISPVLGLLAPVNPAPSNLTVNINPQFIDKVSGIVAQEVSGTQNFGPEASELLQLIERFGGSRAPELATAVYELEDSGSKLESRVNAQGKLKAFLFKAADKVTDLSLGLLQAYIEKQVGL